MNIYTSSEYSSSSEFEVLSSTDPSEPGLSERNVKKTYRSSTLGPNSRPGSAAR